LVMLAMAGGGGKLDGGLMGASAWIVSSVEGWWVVLLERGFWIVKEVLRGWIDGWVLSCGS
jgi:hypothetical protein